MFNMFDLQVIKDFYDAYGSKVSSIRNRLGRPLTLTEKILFSHMYPGERLENFQRGTDFANFSPDRVAMQDATAQMAILQFMNSGKKSVCVPTSIHCDHLICAHTGVQDDLKEAKKINSEVYDFLKSAASCYGMGFWNPGAGIIHQIVLENYAFPGGMMVGTDSHTPNAGGLCMLAIGVGGADAVDVMTGMQWELKVPKIIGVHLTGKLEGWASPKDVILHLAGILSVKGGTNSIIEYFGEGTESLSCTGKATICNMGAEVGATCSVFPYDEKMSAYLKATDRLEVVRMAERCRRELCADAEIIAEPEKYYDRVIDINLSDIEPYINGPFTPDAANRLSEMESHASSKDYPTNIEVALIGSCTNSSYEDLTRAASVLKAGEKLGLKPKAKLIINPGSEQIKATAQRDGLIDTFENAGAVIMTCACGPCIGQWKRITDDNTRRNSIVTSFNRNFAKRADGNPETHAFIVSPEIAAAISLSGRFAIPEGLSAPCGEELPIKGFAKCENGYDAPSDGAPEPIINPESERLQRLEPFAPYDGKDFKDLPLLIKVKGKCTTDHISMAGPWLRFRGHLNNISENMLLGAVDAFTGETGPVAPRARMLGQSVVIAEDNYGEGSSREHAAMEPRFLGVKAIIAKSFARIHETNLKKQGVLALTFKNPDDYCKVQQGDKIDILCSNLEPDSEIKVVLHHMDGNSETFNVRHTYNEQQIKWFNAGSALNSLWKK